MRFIYLLAIVILPFCIKAQELYFPPLLGDTWDTTDPATLDWCPEKLDSLQAFVGERDSKAFIILKDGKIVVEWYYDQFTRDSLWYWASAGKTLRAFATGIAREEGHLSLDDPTSDHLGVGWTSLPPAQEENITIWHQLTMTSGLDDGVADWFCTEPNCLQYLAEPGTRWAYHNAPYTLLKDLTEAATGQSYNIYFNQRVRNKIGMNGFWLDLGYNNIYFSNPRSMARFGLLILNKGIWDVDTLLHDRAYFEAMVTPSQDINESYGYLWWLNGYDTYMIPGTRIVFDGPLIPAAPMDLIAGLGANDQKLYVVPSENLVVIRMGNTAGPIVAAPSSFDNLLWEQISDLSCTTSVEAPDKDRGFRMYPNPVNNIINLEGIKYLAGGFYQIQTVHGMTIRRADLQDVILVDSLPGGIYFLTVYDKDGALIEQVPFVKSE